MKYVEFNIHGIIEINTDSDIEAEEIAYDMNAQGLIDAVETDLEVNVLEEEL